MKTFVISDQHFGHANILNFLRTDGITKVRPEFSSVEEMNETMVYNHNRVVDNEDKVYFLGDIAFNARVFNEIMPRLKGKKSLILGNHDNLRMSEYYKYFRNIYSARYLKHDNVPIVLCHYPQHSQTNYPKFPLCIHGHIHEKTIVDDNYFNVSVEKINYTPITIDEILFKLGIK